MKKINLKRKMSQKMTIYAILTIAILILSTNVILLENQEKTSKSDENFLLQSTEKKEINRNLENIKGFFTKNNGQLENNEIYFTYTSHEKTFEFLESSVVIKLFKTLDEKTIKSSIVKLTYENSNNVIPVGNWELSHKSNFYIGNDCSKWRSNVPNYEKIIYENVYEGIDLVYYFNEKGLKYDWVVKPYADPNQIVERFEGINTIYLNNDRGITIKTEAGEIKEETPYSYQKIYGNEIEIDVSFRIAGDNRIKYNIGDYDSSNNLIIDPLIYSTFVGGSDWDKGYDIVLDSENNAYITGYTKSLDFPTTPGCYNSSNEGDYDVFVFKLNSNGSNLLYSTYIGGSDDDRGFDIAIDSENNTYITGWTKSSDFPTTVGCYNSSNVGGYDIFVLKLNSDGSNLIYSTYVGGNSNEGGWSIALDSGNNTYISGKTESSDFPTTPGCFDNSFNGTRDVFVFKLNSDGSNLVYSTYIGGSGYDDGYGLVIDSNNNVYVTGETNSSDFPTTSGCYNDSLNGTSDVFIFGLNSDGSSLLYSTYVGGSDEDGGNDIGIDSQNNTYITGYTNSSGFPTTSGCYDGLHNGGSDVFVLKLNSDGSDLLYSTFIGGSNDDDGYGLILDSQNNVYITGKTSSPDFPTTLSCYDDSLNGTSDVCVLKLNSDCTSLRYSTFVGGSQLDMGLSIALDSINNAYITGETESLDFPAILDCFDNSSNGVRDVFVFKFELNNLPTADNLSCPVSEVFRTDAITLFANGSDVQDIESDLTPKFEYKSPTGSWDDTWISNINFNIALEYWEATFTPSTVAELGLYDFRVMFTDLDAGVSSWLTEMDQVEVKNNLPTADDLSYSETEVFRTDSFTLFANGTDIEDDESDLTATFEYRFSIGWDDTWISNINYNIALGYWEATFTPPIEAELGDYDFRVKFEDLNVGESSWLTEMDQVEVINNLPTADDLSYSEIEVLRTDSITLYANGTDVEDDESDLTVTIEYQSPTGLWESTWISNINFNIANSYWEATFTPPIEAELGDYDFRVKFEDLDFEESSWLTEMDQVEVKNNLPTADDLSYSEIEVLRTDSITLYANGTDVEDDEADFTATFQYSAPSGSWESTWISNINYNVILEHWEATFTPPTVAELGLYDFQVKFEDLDLGESSWLTEMDQVEVKNNLPTADDLSYSEIEVLRTDSITLFANGTDVEDLESALTATFEYKSPTGSWDDVWISDINYNIALEIWEATFTPPAPAELGFYDFRIMFTDLDAGVSSWLTEMDQVEIKNNLPTADDLSYSEIEVLRTDPITLFTNGTDVEDLESALTATFEYRSPTGSWDDVWISDINYSIALEYWEATFTPPAPAELGFYDFRIMFTDLDAGVSSWLTEMDQVEVKNNLPTADDLSYSETEVFRTDSITLFANGTDVEDLESALTATFEYKSPTGSWDDVWISDINYNIALEYWEATFTPPTVAELELYDFRVMFTDLDAGDSGWLTEMDQVEIKNNLPIADNLSYSEIEVLRTESITLFANGTDVEDLESALTATFEYKSPTGIWDDTWISNINYNIAFEHWEATFTPPTVAELGLYDFRVMFTDLDAGESNWLTEINQVEVKNNLPNADNLSYSETEVFRTDSITLFANGTDVEDLESALTATFEYRSPSGNWNDTWISNINYNITLEYWKATFAPPTVAELGLYDFQVKFEDLDAGESSWLTEIDQVEVKNNLPTADNLSYSEIEVLRTDSITLYANGTDVEDDEADFTATFEYRSPTGIWDDTWISNINYNIALEYWEATFTPSTVAELGLYDFRVMFTDLDAGESSWLTEIDQVEVKNNLPTADNLSYSKSEVFRTDSITLFANGTDVEDLESVLTATFEYKSPSSNWDDTWISNINYNIALEYWEATFTPSTVAELGLYDFRVMFTDLDAGVSSWLTEMDQVEVKNNLPTADDLSYSESEVFRTDSITLFANGTDVEDLESALTATFEYRSPTGIWNDVWISNINYNIVLEYWEATFTPPTVAELGLYDFRVMFTDLDAGVSSWLTEMDQVEVKNNLPTADDLSYSETEVFRTNSIMLFANGTDVEDDESDFTATFEYRSPTGIWDDTWISNINYNITLEYWEATFTPPTIAELGLYDFRVMFTDLDAGTSSWLTELNQVEVKNNLPTADDLSYSESKVFRTDSITLYANGTDVEDLESALTPTFEYRSPTGIWDGSWISDINYNIALEYWEATFTPPTVAELGLYDFRVMFTDLDAGDSGWLTENDTVEVKNNPPEVINMTFYYTEVYRTESIQVYANGSDIEDQESELYPCEMEYRAPNGNWENILGEYYQNDSAYICWIGIFTPSTIFELGLYDFRVRFRDLDNDWSSWNYSNDSIEVMNNPPEAIDLNFSLNLVIRTQTLIIYANGTDIENLESDLICEMQYKSPTGNWEDLIDELFVSGHFEGIYTPNLSAELGYYDFRVRFEDLDNDWGSWYYSNDSVFIENKTDIIQANVTPNATIEGEVITITAIINGPLNSTDVITAYIQKSESTIETVILQNSDYRTYSGTLNTTGKDGLYVIDFYSKDVIEDEIYKNNFICFAVSTPIPPKGVFTEFFTNITENNLTLINAKSFVNMTLEILLNNTVENASINIAEYFLNPKDEFVGSFEVDSFFEIEATENIDENLSYANISFYYDDSLLPSWLEEENLQIYYWNVTINEWEIVINSGYNPIDNYLWINSTHFGIFGIFVYTVDVYCQENIVYTRPNLIVNNTINIKNIGNIRDEISLYFMNVPTDWIASLNKYSIWLNSQEDTNVILTIYAYTQIEGSYDIYIYGKSTENLGFVWDYVTTTTIVDNTPPIANAGNNQTINEDTIAYLFGENSTDNFGIEKYSWDFDATDGIQEDSIGMNVNHNFTDPGTYTITLTITDYVDYTNVNTCIVTVLDTEPPEIPTNLTVSTVPIGNQLYLSWDSNKDKDLAGYNVYRSLTSGTTGYTKINTFTVIGTSYQDTNLTNGITYYYVIKAVDYGGHESEPSQEANGIPAIEPFSFGTSIYINQNNANQYLPSIAVYNNKIYVVWIDTRNGNADIYFAKSSGGSFEGLKKVNDDIGSANQYYPSIAVDNNGICIVWEDYRNGNADIYFAFSSDDGGSFTNNRVDHDALNTEQRDPSITLKDNNVYVVWEDKRNGNWDVYFSYSTDYGNTFSNEIKVNNGTTNVNDIIRLSPTIAVNNEIYVTWHDNRNTNYDIFFSKSINGAYFENDFKVNDDAGSNSQRYPTITYDDEIYIAWSDERNGNWDIYAADSTDGESWNNICVENNTSDQLYPSIAHGSDVYIAWQDKRNGDWDIYASSLNEITSVEVKRDNNNQYYPSIAVGDRIYVAWQNENSFWNIQFVSSIEITDTTPPSIFSIRAQPETVLEGDNVTISAFLTDPSGIIEVNAYIQKGDENNVLEVRLFEIYDGTYVNTINTNGFDDLYVIDIFAKDYRNNSIELENRVCFAVTSDNSCEGVFQALFNGNYGTIDASSQIDVVLEISTKTNLTNSSICMAKYSKSDYDYYGAISLNKLIEIEVENGLLEVLDYIILKIYYTDSELEQLDEDKMKIYYWNEMTKVWEELTTYINEIENYLWTNLTHLSIFGVFEQIMEVQTDESTNGNPSTTIVHEFTVKNLGSGDTFNFDVNSSNAWNVNLIGENSLYFNEDESKKISVEVTIPNNAIAFEEDILTFNVSATNTTAYLSITTKAIVNLISKVFVSADSQDQTLEPGEFFEYQFTVENQGNGEDTFTLNVTSEHNWYTKIISNDFVVLSNGEEKTIYVTIMVPFEEMILAGTTDILTFKATSKDSSSFSSATSKTIVKQVFGIVLRCEKNQTDYFTFPNDFFKYTLQVINIGNGKDTFRLGVTKKEANWSAEFSQNMVTIEGFESVNVTLMVTPPSYSKIGSKGVVSIQATSEGNDTKYYEISTLSTVPKPDLWIKELYFNVGGAVLVGQKIKIIATICNSGSIAKNFYVRITIKDSAGWEHLMQQQIYSLAAGESMGISIEWEATGKGLRQIQVEVDSFDKIFESDESNNVLISNSPFVVEHQVVSTSFESNFIMMCINVAFVVILCGSRKKRRKKT